MTKLFMAWLIMALPLHAISQTVTYEVYALKYSGAFNDKPYPLKLLVLDAPEKETGSAVFMFWLIKGNNGKNILVDAGFHQDSEEAGDFGLVNYIRPDSMLLRIGLKAADITDVIITHPHWDHIDGVDLFPNAHVWMQKEDYNYFVGAAWTEGSGGFDKRDVRKMIELNLAKKLTLVDGDDKEIIPGVRVYTGSRHTFNSQYVGVKTGTEKVVLASDNAYTYYNIEHLKSAAKGSTFDSNGYVNAIKRMKTLVSDDKFIIPGHDALVFSKFTKVADGVVRIK
jgi:glyoxylase-like metal-dependent hydrolase (beta-lactamase superfamily II)